MRMHELKSKPLCLAQQAETLRLKVILGTISLSGSLLPHARDCWVSLPIFHSLTLQRLQYLADGQACASAATSHRTKSQEPQCHSHLPGRDARKLLQTLD